MSGLLSYALNDENTVIEVLADLQHRVAALEEREQRRTQSYSEWAREQLRSRQVTGNDLVRWSNRDV